jgi:predicted Rossmann fold nucleotide-binding protein DprA/Smf involved in DNA uptake
MKDVQKELSAISVTLSSLVKQVEKIVEAIETASGKAAAVKKTRAVKKAKAPAKKKTAAAKKRRPKKVAGNSDAQAAASGQTMLDSIYGMISRSRGGITVERLKKRSGLEARQVSNALYKLTKKGKVETLSRGLYVKRKN